VVSVPRRVDVAIALGGRSLASNLVTGDTNGVWDVFVRDMRTGVTRRVSVGSDGGQSDSYSGDESISADGRQVAFTSLATNLVPGDTNDDFDVFVRDEAALDSMR
jgi:Tol biopolymer transport system component